MSSLDARAHYHSHSTHVARTSVGICTEQFIFRICLHAKFYPLYYKQLLKTYACFDYKGWHEDTISHTVERIATLAIIYEETITLCRTRALRCSSLEYCKMAMFMWTWMHNVGKSRRIGVGLRFFRVSRSTSNKLNFNSGKKISTTCCCCGSLHTPVNIVPKRFAVSTRSTLLGLWVGVGVLMLTSAPSHYRQCRRQSDRRWYSQKIFFFSMFPFFITITESVTENVYYIFCFVPAGSTIRI